MATIGFTGRLDYTLAAFGPFNRSQSGFNESDLNQLERACLRNQGLDIKRLLKEYPAKYGELEPIHSTLSNISSTEMLKFDNFWKLQCECTILMSMMETLSGDYIDGVRAIISNFKMMMQQIAVHIKYPGITPLPVSFGVNKDSVESWDQLLTADSPDDMVDLKYKEF